MTEDIALLEQVREVLRADLRIGFDAQSIVLALADGDLVIEGEVADVSVKRRLLRTAAAAIGGRFIIDRLRVRPATPMQDGAIRDLVRDALLDEPALSHCRVREYVKGDLEPARDLPDATGTIDIRVQDGVVTLDRDVTGLAQKRWVPGNRDVINGLGVTPPDADTAFAIADAVRLVLEKAPFCQRGSLAPRLCGARS